MVATLTESLKLIWARPILRRPRASNFKSSTKLSEYTKQTNSFLMFFTRIILFFASASSFLMVKVSCLILLIKILKNFLIQRQPAISVKDLDEILSRELENKVKRGST